MDRIAQLRLAARIARKHALKFAGPLKDVSNLRFQAVFMMGAGGSGKGFVSHKWLKYMPGAPPEGEVRKRFQERSEEHVPEMERALSNLNFEKSIEDIRKNYNIKVELVDPQKASIPFRLYTYPPDGGKERLVPPEEWQQKLPPAVYDQVKGLEDAVFGTPIHEVPSFWRQVNPDIYKEELAGYLEDQPGWVHEMSSEMSKAYFEAAVKTGDPIFVDTTGAKLSKMKTWIDTAKANGYRTSVVFVVVPLTVNHIRNATRSRNVKPSVITDQWKKIVKNFAPLKAASDVAKVIVNRNDSADIAKWRQYGPQIDEFIRKDGQYDSLFDLIKRESPSELGNWGKLLQETSGGPGMTDRQRRIDELRQKHRKSFKVGNLEFTMNDERTADDDRAARNRARSMEMFGKAQPHKFRSHHPPIWGVIDQRGLGSYLRAFDPTPKMEKDLRNRKIQSLKNGESWTDPQGRLITKLGGMSWREWLRKKHMFPTVNDADSYDAWHGEEFI